MRSMCNGNVNWRSWISSICWDVGCNIKGVPTRTHARRFLFRFLSTHYTKTLQSCASLACPASMIVGSNPIFPWLCCWANIKDRQLRLSPTSVKSWYVENTIQISVKSNSLIQYTENYKNYILNSHWSIIHLRLLCESLNTHSSLTLLHMITLVVQIEVIYRIHLITRSSLEVHLKPQLAS